MLRRVVAAAPSSLVIVEGNISAGKSTLCQELEKCLPGYKVFLEPLLENPFLDSYYKDPKKYALRMQMFLLRHRFVTYILSVRQFLTSGTGVILDRSIFSDSVFAVKNHQDGNISKDGFMYYLHQREKMLSFVPLPHLVVFLNVDPQVCHHRLHNVRCRKCEESVSLDYLSGLHDGYIEFLSGMRDRGAKTMIAPWDKFGDSREVANSISQSSDSDPFEGVDTSVFFDDELVLKLLRPDFVCPEAEDEEDYNSIEYINSVRKLLQTAQSE